MPVLRVLICQMPAENDNGNTKKVVDLLCPDRVYFIVPSNNQSYSTKYADLKEDLQRSVMSHSSRNLVKFITGTYDYPGFFKVIDSITNEELTQGNSVDIFADGIPSYTSAATLVSTIMHVHSFIFAYDRIEDLLTFDFDAPPRDIVVALRIFIRIKDEAYPRRDYDDHPRRVTDDDVIKELGRSGILRLTPSEMNGIVSQATRMRYRRNYRDYWFSQGWVEHITRQGYFPSDKGRIAAGLLYTTIPDLVPPMLNAFMMDNISERETGIREFHVPEKMRYLRLEYPDRPIRSLFKVQCKGRRTD